MRCRIGVTPPKIEVRFHNVVVDAKVHVGSRALPTLTNDIRNMAEVSHVYSTALQTANIPSSAEIVIRDSSGWKEVAGQLSNACNIQGCVQAIKHCTHLQAVC